MLRRYLLTWAALTLLTALTYGVSFLHLGEMHLAAGVAIGLVKAMLVALFFMHLWDDAGTVRLWFAVSFLLLAVLLGFTSLDLATRFAPSRPGWQPRRSDSTNARR